MGAILEQDVKRIEESVVRFFSPNGLATVVILIVLSVMLFSGSGIENRTTDDPGTGNQRAVASPILHTP
ncbi:MAG: hypothetical protein V2I40_01225 [Desulfobacteraceae bacterium]|jgi:hypothetical protein|nr:hypothetical protein [Desulfobacteraceae bacterium]